MEKHVYSTLAINRQVRKKRKTPNQTHQYMHVRVDIYTTQKHTTTQRRQDPECPALRTAHVSIHLLCHINFLTCSALHIMYSS